MKPFSKKSSAHLLPLLFTLCVVGSPLRAADNMEGILDEAISKVLLQGGRPTAGDFSPAELQDLKLLLETGEARNLLKANIRIFKFLNLEPIPGLSTQTAQDADLAKRCKAVDARKAAMINWLVTEGAREQFQTAARGDGALIGDLLTVAAGHGGTLSTQAVLDIAGDMKIPAQWRRKALLASLRNAWLFPETTKALLAGEPSCNYDATGDPLRELITNSTGYNDVPAIRENISATLTLLLAKTTSISQEVIKSCIEAGWAEGVEKFLAVDPSHDPEDCIAWLVSAKLSRSGYPEADYTRLKACLGDLASKQKAAIAALPPIRAYFLATDPEHGTEPWVTDGTAAGTHLLADLSPGPRGSEAALCGAGAKGVIIRAKTVGNTQRLLAIPHDGSIRALELVPTDKFRGVANYSFGRGLVIWRSDTGLWQSDGSVEGTQQIAAGKLDFRDMRAFGKRVVVEAVTHHDPRSRDRRDGSSRFYELLPEERKLVPLASRGSSPAMLVDSAMGDRLYFRNGGNLLTTTRLENGSAEGASLAAPTHLLKGQLRTESLNQASAVMADGYLYFTANHMREVAKNDFVSTSGLELYRTDGTPEGTSLVADICEIPGEGSNPAQFVSLGKTLLFTADDGRRGRRLWGFNGETTRMLHDSATVMSMLCTFSSKAYFVSDDEIWSSDGTPEGTRKLTSLNHRIVAAANAGSCLLIATHDPSINKQVLWRTDAGGTRLLRISEVNLSGSNPVFFPAPAAGKQQAQASTRPTAPEEEEKLPERKFKPSPLQDH